MAELSMGYVIVRDKLINSVNSNLKFIPFKDSIEDKAFLIWKRNRFVCPCVKRFLQQIEKNK